MATLSLTDYIVIGVLMVISCGIGIYYWLIGDRRKSTEVIESCTLFDISRKIRITSIATEQFFRAERRYYVNVRSDNTMLSHSCDILYSCDIL